MVGPTFIDNSFVAMESKQLIILVVLSLACSSKIAECSRILGVFPFAARSHYILGNSLMKGLAEAGHDVTIISPFEDKNPPSNGSYRTVLLTGFPEEHEKLIKRMNFFNNSTTNSSFIDDMFFMYEMLIGLINNIFEHPNVKAFLDSGENVDVVIVEQFFSEANKIFAYHFNAHLIIFSSVGASSWVNDIVGNPSPLSYIPHGLTNYASNMTFFQRVHNVISYMSEQLINHLYVFPKNNEILNKYFSNVPNFYDLYHNASLVLLNSHESLSQAVPHVPNMVEIGGYHVKSPKKLPKDLQKYLDEAEEGVIYFSMGSNLKSADLPTERRDAFLRVFSRLKQRVLWKWEDDVLPGQPPNVKLSKWLPQQDVLAHPNVKVFITHGGLLSTIEAIYHGVPILAIPVFADQHSNAHQAVNNGYGLSLPYDDPDFSEDKLSHLLNQLLHNPKYRNNVQRRSKVFHDRPLKPMEAAVFWVEYVIRHNGAPHLRVAGVTLPWYQYLLLDVVAFIAGFTVSVLFLVYLGFRYILRCRKNSSKIKKD